MAAEEVMEAPRLLGDALSAVEVIVRNDQQTENAGSPQEASSSGAQPLVIQRRIPSIAVFNVQFGISYVAMPCI